MKQNTQLCLVIILALISILITVYHPISSQNQLLNPLLQSNLTRERIISQKDLSLANRQSDKWVNNIFKENILLNLAYLRGLVSSPKIDWDKVKQPFTFEFKLEPKQTFAFHGDIDDKYDGKVALTTNAHFNYQEGFKTGGYLFGDGVCHLASIINWVAKEAGLLVEAPTRHDFAPIPDIPKEYGVSIYDAPGAKSSNAKQNLYITNNHPKPITIRFNYQNDQLKVAVVELN